MYIEGEYGGGTGWNETGWMFRGDAELAQERGLAGVCLWKDGTFVWGDANWRIARFDWDVFVEGRTFVLRGRGIGA